MDKNIHKLHFQADQLFDYMTSEFRCTYCREVVEEDQSALPKKDSRLLLAKFNEQLEPLYILLREVEGIRLAPEILEPEPVDINTIRGYDIMEHYSVPCIKSVISESIIVRMQWLDHQEKIGLVRQVDHKDLLLKKHVLMLQLVKETIMKVPMLHLGRNVRYG